MTDMISLGMFEDPQLIFNMLSVSIGAIFDILFISISFWLAMRTSGTNAESHNGLVEVVTSANSD